MLVHTMRYHSQGQTGELWARQCWCSQGSPGEQLSPCRHYTDTLQGDDRVVRTAVSLMVGTLATIHTPDLWLTLSLIEP